MLLRKQAVKAYFIFPHHVTNSSVLPGETGNPEIVTFYLNAACFLPKKTQNIVKLEMWANAQRDGRPAEYRWRPLFNAAKY